MNNLGLYLHVPFCIKKCNYCDFYSISANEASYDRYLDTLKTNIGFWQQKLSDRVLDTIYIGGGTPSVLGTDRICTILNTLRQGFCISENAEVTIEVNPSSTKMLDFSVLKKYGVNRVSMGLQSSSDDELNLLGRAHNRYDALVTIDRLQSAGIDNYSLDVMLGIPLQTYDSLIETLQFCISNEASHISTYMLKIEENTPFFLNKDNLVFADEDAQADLYELTCRVLRENGFRHYEISNFCKNNKISRHNMKYWQLDDYLGFGPSAHSMISQKRFYYPRDINNFCIDSIIYESEGKTAEEYIMLSLRTDVGISFDKYRELFNSEVSSELIAEASSLEKLGLLTIQNNGIILTEKGFLVSNAIISRLLNTGI